ncbi:MAG: sulfotransferase [Planctomycetes bacterium]|nr:sulfotransferase [Planctomycetota bacterium]
MLTCHKNIVIPPECGFAVWLYEEYKAWNDPDSDSLIDRFVKDVLNCRKFETWQLNEVDVREFVKQKRPASYPDALSAVYEWYGLSLGRSFERWGDKNNYYIDHIPTIHAMFPDACYAHIVRDGRNVACSYKNLNQRTIDSRYAPQLPSSIEEIAEQWQKNMETIRRSFDQIGRAKVHEVRLEDLVVEPEKILTQLCDHVGEEFDPSMLVYHSTNKESVLEPTEFLQWKEKTLKPLISTETERYRSELTEKEIQVFHGVAGNILKRYGYSMQ